jgi:hypothetical protein
VLVSGGLAGVASAEDVRAVRSVIVTGGAGGEGCGWVGIAEGHKTGAEWWDNDPGFMVRCRGSETAGLYACKDRSSVRYGYRTTFSTRLDVTVGQSAELLLQVRPWGTGVRWSVTVDGVLRAAGIDPEPRAYGQVWLKAAGACGHAATDIETTAGIEAHLWDGVGELAGWGVASGAALVAGGYLQAAVAGDGTARMTCAKRF